MSLIKQPVQGAKVQVYDDISLLYVQFFYPGFFFFENGGPQGWISVWNEGVCGADIQKSSSGSGQVKVVKVLRYWVSCTYVS